MHFYAFICVCFASFSEQRGENFQILRSFEELPTGFLMKLKCSNRLCQRLCGKYSSLNPPTLIDTHTCTGLKHYCDWIWSPTCITKLTDSSSPNCSHTNMMKCIHAWGYKRPELTRCSLDPLKNVLFPLWNKSGVLSSWVRLKSESMPG